MRTLTQNWIPFVSLFLILLLVVAAGEPSHGLSVQVAYPDKNCGSYVVARVLENGKVRILASPQNEDLGRDEFASRLSEVFKNRVERLLFIEADPNLTFQSVAEVIDMSEKIVGFVAILTPSVQPRSCLSIHVQPTFTDYNYVETPVKMKPVPLWPWQ